MFKTTCRRLVGFFMVSFGLRKTNCGFWVYFPLPSRHTLLYVMVFFAIMSAYLDPRAKKPNQWNMNSFPTLICSVFTWFAFKCLRWATEKKSLRVFCLFLRCEQVKTIGNNKVLQLVESKKKELCKKRVFLKSCFTVRRKSRTWLWIQKGKWFQVQQ